jgi:AmiR/NasT family two-component response regulator
MAKFLKIREGLPFNRKAALEAHFDRVMEQIAGDWNKLAENRIAPDDVILNARREEQSIFSHLRFPSPNP